MLPASLCAKIMVFRRITRIIEVVLNERAVILMTVLSMVFGLIPLMMAHGVGANGSRSLATGVIGGMIVGTLALLFLVPSLFITFQYIQEQVKRK